MKKEKVKTLLAITTCEKCTGGHVEYHSRYCTHGLRHSLRVRLSSVEQANELTERKR